MSNPLTRTVTVIESSQPNIKGKRGSFSDYLSFANIILLGDSGAGKAEIFEAATRAERVDGYSVRDFLAVPGIPGEQDIIYLDGLGER